MSIYVKTVKRNRETGTTITLIDNREGESDLRLVIRRVASHRQRQRSRRNIMRQPQLDTLDRGTVVRLGFNNGEYEEIAIFAGIIGEGDDRQARFIQAHELEPKAFEWDAYRYLGRWAFGSSAQSLRLLEVIQ